MLELTARTKSQHARSWLLSLAFLSWSCSSEPTSPETSPADNEPETELARDAGSTLDAAGRSTPGKAVEPDTASPRPASLDASGAPRPDDGSTPSDAGLPTPPKSRPIDGGTISGLITGGSGISSPTSQVDVKLGERGYVEEEFFLEGDATAYASKGERGLDGNWQVSTNGRARYKTRVLVRRPARAADFNGTAMVEWLNVTGSMDVGMGYLFGWEELLRGGYAYVGVSVQQAGVSALKSGDAVRYAGLVHPGDIYAYDIFAQAGAAILWPSTIRKEGDAGNAGDALGGLAVKRAFAYGQSQSAMRMVTFVDAVHPLTHVYDGFFIHSRAGWGAPVGAENDAFLGDGKPVHVRTDTDARVLQFFSESEVFLSLGPAFGARQPDSSHIRTWEVAGAAHADTRVLGDGAGVCGPVNDGQQHLVVKAALRAMHVWLKDGVEPPPAPLLEVIDGKKIARDTRGNALGGIRTPAIDVPIATLSGEASAGNEWNPVCSLFGQTIPFTKQVLRELYPTHQAYVDAVVQAARKAVDTGFMLAEDEQAILAEAMSAAVPE